MPRFKSFPEPLKAGLLAMVLVAAFFCFQANYGLDLMDEGFLWYGAIHTHLGQVPIRDFQAYDPGRYYWASFFFSVFGDGLLALRLSMAFFQWIALFFAFLAMRRAIPSWQGLSVFGTILVLWMLLPFRYVEHGLPLIAVFFAMRQLERPVPRQFFFSGLFVGIAAFFGKNHALYACLSFYSLFLFDLFQGNRQSTLQKQLALFAGFLTGCLPLAMLFFLKNGFFGSYLNSVRSVIHLGTNLPAAAPWPWTVQWHKICETFPAGYLRSLGWMNQMSTGLFFLIVPLFYFVLFGYLVCRRRPLSLTPLFAASVFVGVFYLHHIFSRADITHMAEGIGPFLMAITALCSGGSKDRSKPLTTVVISALAFLSLASAGLSGDLCHKYFLPGKNALARVALGPDKVWLIKPEADRIESVLKTVSKNVRRDENILVLPYWPAFYCLLGKASPIREIYFLFPSTEEDQKHWIAELEEKKVDWVLWGQERVFGRQFEQTHIFLWKYLKDRFEKVPAEGGSSGYFLLHRKDGQSLGGRSL